MNSKQRNQNRHTALMLRKLIKAKVLANHTCENCGEKGGHWIVVQGPSIEAIMTGKDDSIGFYSCQKKE